MANSEFANKCHSPFAIRHSQIRPFAIRLMPKTIIFANGISADPNENRHYFSPGDTIICADGGTLHALAMGLTPDLIVGDLDSLPAPVVAEMEAKGVEIQRHPVDKDQTDLELALQIAIQRGAKEILLLTALGGRLDQTLANILLLTRPEWRGVRLRLAEGAQSAWLLRGPDSLTLRGQTGDTLSVVALSQNLRELTLQGVKWPLNKANVSLGSTLTISNAFVEVEAKIQLAQGMALAIVGCQSQADCNLTK
ncbi:MAG TPA: thiamine diphosphokinase [Chloroflexi bacterium]|nr:thiamine diphosphokinase [Chloroflexota bacterium]